MAGRGQCDLLEEGDIMARLPKKLREIIDNVKPRDEYSIGVYDPVPTGPRSCEYVFGGLGLRKDTPVKAYRSFSD